MVEEGGKVREVGMIQASDWRPEVFDEEREGDKQDKMKRGWDGTSVWGWKWRKAKKEGVNKGGEVLLIAFHALIVFQCTFHASSDVVE